MVTRILTDAKSGFATNSTYDVRTAQEQFVRLIKFFDNCGACGITRIASHYGKSGTYTTSSPLISLNGAAFDYWDATNQAGCNAWAVYRFGNATVPFYMLIQWAIYTTTNFNFGDSPGNPGTHYDTSWGGVGIAFAMRQDGTSPWAGGTANVGADAKGATVWTPGTSNVFVWPRSCSPGGGGNSTRAHTMPLYLGSWSDSGLYTMIRTHVVVDENNVIIVTDYHGVCAPVYTYFGKYTPQPGLTPPVPYFCIRDANLPILQTGTGLTYGSIANNTSIGQDGGIAIPAPTATETVSGLFLDVPFNAANTSVNWNTSPVSGSGATFVETPLLLLSAEGSYLGLVGMSDTFARQTYSQNYMSTMNNKSRVIFTRLDSSSGIQRPCLTVPWSPNAPARGTCSTRDGYEITV